MEYEAKRKEYKPDKVRILFVGESRPQQGTFFYFEDSNLFTYTKQAFEKANVNFTLDKFKELGCWLYDVCNCPVNNFTKAARNAEIKKCIRNLINIIEELKPYFIIVVKRGYFGNTVMQELKTTCYNEQNTFNIPFPSCGHQLQYRDELAHILEQILRII